MEKAWLESDFRDTECSQRLTRLIPVIHILAICHKAKGLGNIWKGAGGHRKNGRLHLFRVLGKERILH
jgi:hypothetical protein